MADANNFHVVRFDWTALLDSLNWSRCRCCCCSFGCYLVGTIAIYMCVSCCDAFSAKQFNGQLYQKHNMIFFVIFIWQWERSNNTGFIFAFRLFVWCVQKAKFNESHFSLFLFVISNSWKYKNKIVFCFICTVIVVVVVSRSSILYYTKGLDFEHNTQRTQQMRFY